MTENNGNRVWYGIAQRIALVSTLFAVLLSVLMIVNYYQTTTIDPLHSEALTHLMLKLRDNPDDEVLKEQIRALDLLARKAYFTSQWQVRTGGFMLFAFVVLIVISLKYISSLRTRFPELTEARESEQTWGNILLAKKYIGIAGMGLFAFALVLGVMTEDELAGVGTADSGAASESAGQQPTYPAPEEMRLNWPNFRGPEGIGIAYVDTVPTQWDGTSGDRILWKTEIPITGFNSPIVWEKRLFLSGADEQVQVVYCIDADSGEILWETKLNDVPGTPDEKPSISDDTGFAAATMATDGTRVFAIFGTGDIACLDFEGNRVWARNLGVPDNHYGHSSSLITYRDMVLVQYDDNNGGRLIALEAATGTTVYDQPREIDISWASPICVNTGARDEVILNSSPAVISHDPATGRELWRVDCMSGEVAPSLAYADGMVFAVNEYAILAAISLEGTPDVAWESEDDLSEVSSPLATDAFVFVATSYGTVSCYDRASGERYWYEDLPRGFYSSPILVGENVYLMDMKGTMFVFSAASEFNLVSTCELGENAVAVPAFMPGRIYIRGFENLYCIGE
jgi:outer membrane protein assembly factor BamB